MSDQNKTTVTVGNGKFTLLLDQGDVATIEPLIREYESLRIENESLKTKNATLLKDSEASEEEIKKEAEKLKGQIVALEKIIEDSKHKVDPSEIEEIASLAIVLLDSAPEKGVSHFCSLTLSQLQDLYLKSKDPSLTLDSLSCEAKKGMIQVYKTLESPKDKNSSVKHQQKIEQITKDSYDQRYGQSNSFAPQIFSYFPKKTEAV